jgi:hypothetical protein
MGDRDKQRWMNYRITRSLDVRNNLAKAPIREQKTDKCQPTMSAPREC